MLFFGKLIMHGGRVEWGKNRREGEMKNEAPIKKSHDRIMQL